MNDNIKRIQSTNTFLITGLIAIVAFIAGFDVQVTDEQFSVFNNAISAMLFYAFFLIVAKIPIITSAIEMLKILDLERIRINESKLIVIENTFASIISLMPINISGNWDDSITRGLRRRRLNRFDGVIFPTT